jgi:1-deoxy-D-xylulose-5-phosphate synthase
MAETCLDVASRCAREGIGVTVVDPRWVKPVPAALADLARDHRFVVTVEDNVRAGGVGAAIAQALRDARVEVPLRDFGIPARFLDHGKRAEVLAEIGLTAQDIARAVLETVSSLDRTAEQHAVND